MAARRGGAGPKDPDQVSNATRSRDRTNAMRVVQSKTAPAPELPDYMHNGDDWPEQTLKWWEVWSNSPLTEDYRAEDWQDLIDCAAIHGRFWSGEMKAASELRLRMARHGATREDRARLRIVFATAEQIEKKTGTVNTMGTNVPARGRRRGLSAADTKAG